MKLWQSDHHLIIKQRYELFYFYFFNLLLFIIFFEQHKQRYDLIYKICLCYNKSCINDSNHKLRI